MPRSPMSVKGIRNLLEAMTRRMKQADEAGLAARMVMEMHGDFALERDAGAEAGADASGVVPVSGVPVDAGMSGGLSSSVAQAGEGDVVVTYELSTRAWREADR